MSVTRWLFTALSFALMFGASAWVVAGNWPTGGMPLLAWTAHAGALTAVAIEVTTRALKMQASAIAVGLPLRFGTALRVCLGGDFAAAITPARSGAEPARFLVLAESGMPVAGRVLVLFLELFLEMCSLAVVCVALAWLFQGRGASVRGLLALVGGYSTAVLGAGAIGVLLARRNAHGPPPAWARRIGVHAGRWRVLQRTLRQLRSSVQALRQANPRFMLAAFLGSVVHVLCKVAALPLLVFLGDRSFALTMDTLAPLVLWPLALFYGGVVVPAPGGGGFIEGAFAVTLKSAIPVGIFAATLLWWRFYTFYLYLVVGGLAAGDAALRAIRRREATESLS
ncbi:MAG: flippase-like domain-containing protein [Gemmatimonadaceae bacterium]|nr:flippase-like domain-containing protein [Gemmatimonadaceae bacterium]